MMHPNGPIGGFVTHILAVANQKGGVGKTTTAVNLAASLVATKRRVLLVDLDPQGNATMGSGVDKSQLETSTYEVLLGEAPIDEALYTTEMAGYDILPTNADLTAAEIDLISLERKEYRLADALSVVLEDYDYILIDCPPALSLLTLNAFTAANGLLIPVQCEYYALEGLSGLVATVNRLQQIVNPQLKIVGILRTLYDPRLSLTLDVSSQLIEHFGDLVYSTVIPRNVRLAEAPSYGLPVLCYDREARGAKAYLALAGELNRKLNTRPIKKGGFDVSPPVKDQSVSGISQVSIERMEQDQ